MKTYFVTGAYRTDGYTNKFDIVFDLRPVNAENFIRQIRLELDLDKQQQFEIHNIVKL
jgi:hypothetical protein